MKFSTLNTPRAMAVELGSRLRVARLNRNLTQEQVGNSAGISRYIVKELEHGKGKVEDLMATLIALSLTDQLENLLPTQKVSPIEIFKMKGHERTRASGNKDENVVSVATKEDLGW
ncbi:helix-turn-helix transcriptional regulator [Acinetobacter kyonggiensis]|jgi:putative transcriptional regulator|uniref:Putative transcriptional regulator n=1 Tax=Acinetobacter kyonggiensis TaxID=595670 RepID=A0A1H3N7T4_9GAMM|nr:transcriptional regulator [Acinetobacter kyonggiensis]SDY85007.1 putative transcriptional regulator [Acinetobacter kyonggiensis]